MFDRYYYKHIHKDHSREAARILGDKLESISDAEIKSKDRVDIPLRDYLRLKEDLERTSRELRHANFLLASMGIPAEVVNRIDGDSIRVETCDDPCYYKRTYRITFDTDASPLY